MSDSIITKNRNRNPVISLSRVLGMLFIVLCHIIGYYTLIPGYASLGQFFNCGVQMFLFISGYLYGGKTVEGFKRWYLKRVLTVALPAVMLSAIVISILFFLGHKTSINTVIAYFLDLEGLLFVSGKLFGLLFTFVPNLAPLWFTTVIMLCYLLVPLLQKLTNRINDNQYIFIVIILIFGGSILSIIIGEYISLTYFFLFSIGFLLGKIHWLDRIELKHFIVYSALFIIALIGRVLMHKAFDDSYIYTQFAAVTHMIIGTWFVVLFAFIYHLKPSLLEKVASWRMIVTLDKYSFYVYLVHGLFCMGIWNVYDKMPLWLATIMFVFGTVVSALLLRFLVAITQKYLCRM